MNPRTRHAPSRLADTTRRRRIAPALARVALATLALAWTLAGSTTAQAELRPLFRVRVGEPEGPSKPVFTEGRAYLIDADGRVHALDTGRGRTVWTAKVRCGRDAFALVGKRLVCGDSRRGRLLVLAADTGRLLSHERVEGGPYAFAVVGETLVMRDHRTGRLLGYDVPRRTWSFDHGTEADAPSSDRFTSLSLGGRYFFTQDEWRSLWSLDVATGRMNPVGRSDTPVRIDRGDAAEVAHGLIWSHDARNVVAFDIARGRRAWRHDMRDVTGSRRGRVREAKVVRGKLVVLAESSGETDEEVSVPPRSAVALIIDLRSGELERTVPLARALPFPALVRLGLGLRDACDAVDVSDITLVDDAIVVSVGARCEARRARFPQGWVVAIDPDTGSALWSSTPGAADRLVPTSEGVYGLWGRAGIPHAERSVVELDSRTGAPTARRVVGYTPSWSVIHEDQLWIGTTSGTVVVYDR